MLSVLCSMHHPLSGTVVEKRPSPTAAQLTAAIAEGQRQRSAGAFDKALASFELAIQLSRRLGDRRQEAISLNKAGACQLRLFQYRAARISLERAHELADQVHDQAVAGAADINLSTLYEQLGDFDRANEITRQAAASLETTSRTDLYVRALLNHADTQLEQGQPKEAELTFRKAIQAAQKSKMAGEEAMAQNFLGIALLQTHDLSGAETALLKAYQLRIANKDAEGVTLVQVSLAELRYLQGRYPESLATLDNVLASRGAQVREIPKHETVNLRGRILLALERKPEALAELHRAVELAATWRREALPGDASSTRTVTLLNAVYQDYTELAAQLSLERHDLELAREALEALGDNRAESLREQITLALNREGRLPPRYFELLSQLQTAQENATLSPTPDSAAKVQQIRLALSDIENRLGIETGTSSKEIERNSLKKSLRVIQSRLGAEELLLSFCLGEAHSYLWTVTQDQVNLYQLAKAADISAHAATFSEAVRMGRDLSGPGQRLSRDLFSQLSAKDWQKPSWLIVGDGALLNGIPMAALPQLPPANSGTLSISRRLRYLPSELLLVESHPFSHGQTFLGVGDPVYNSADARRTAVMRPAANQARKREGPSIILARLPGSDPEVRTAAQSSGLSGAEILVGKDATTEKVREALESRPGVVHFAVHVVSPNGHPEQAALALSLGSNDIPELLTPEVIASFRVPGSLVVLSGCASVQGRTLPSAGVIGLSRAWLVAGASAVVVSAWPTPDDSGRFFSSFYRHLQDEFHHRLPNQKAKPVSLPKQAATALQLAQIDMQHSNNPKSAPSLWAAYSIISKE